MAKKNKRKRPNGPRKPRPQSDSAKKDQSTSPSAGEANTTKPGSGSSSSRSGGRSGNRSSSRSGSSSSRSGSSSSRSGSRSGNRGPNRSSSRSNSSSRSGSDKPRMRPRFDLPQDEFDKIYRAKVESSLDPSLAISTQKNFEPDRPPLPPKKYGILFVATPAEAIEAPKKHVEFFNEVDEVHISIAAEGSREIDELTSEAKIFAGNAWATVLQRRVEDDWYFKVYPEPQA